MSLGVIRRFDVANMLSPDQALSLAEIAARMGLREGRINHVLRYARLSRAQQGVCGSHYALDLVAIVRWGRFSRSLQGDLVVFKGFALADNVDRTLYDVLHDTICANRSANKTATFDRGPRFSAPQIVNGYDWAALGNLAGEWWISVDSTG
ncbi:hypothetical protein P170DRAFT_477112 [Aspergillus steynii IBT 23096]|uniref:Uncharacterized protein n=1 Tax=Aspergillus steynii IBT 23096 TaxID=1392250 RepID=A0A2I2G6J1_9EURO|nr:uncharacterized protein P170DRAFT_477112 [Aspergillus steynii IBT 23096]PLB48497.1 hypothetical protein P170DRAFT_477112 [Aspergillus steynii IBT 23096]